MGKISPTYPYLGLRFFIFVSNTHLFCCCLSTIREKFQCCTPVLRFVRPACCSLVRLQQKRIKSWRFKDIGMQIFFHIKKICNINNKYTRNYLYKSSLPSSKQSPRLSVCLTDGSVFHFTVCYSPTTGTSYLTLCEVRAKYVQV